MDLKIVVYRFRKDGQRLELFRQTISCNADTPYNKILEVLLLLYTGCIVEFTIS